MDVSAMTIRDQIPSFPELIDFYRARCEVAHGTTDQNQWDYHSTAEREYAEELATNKIMSLIKEGHIRATGRVSETKKGSASRWQTQQYKEHSKVRRYIEVDFWQSAIVVKNRLGFNAARNERSEYTDILLVLEDCINCLAEDVKAHAKTVEAEDPPTNYSGYSTPYIDLMWQAINHFKISDENQPIKETLVEWFLSQKIAGQKISRATAEYLASFIRLPTSRLGGNRPWKVRAEQTQPH
jgi:hypothetical protein